MEPCGFHHFYFKSLVFMISQFLPLKLCRMKCYTAIHMPHESYTALLEPPTHPWLGVGIRSIQFCLDWFSSVWKNKNWNWSKLYFSSVQFWSIWFNSVMLFSKPNCKKTIFSFLFFFSFFTTFFMFFSPFFFHIERKTYIIFSYI